MAEYLIVSVVAGILFAVMDAAINGNPPSPEAVCRLRAHS
jgi:hypothetical protein